MVRGRLLQIILPQQGKGGIITPAHPEGPYMQIHGKLRHELPGKPIQRIRRMGRRCGTSQPTPIPLTCKAVADYTGTRRIKQQQDGKREQTKQARTTQTVNPGEKKVEEAVWRA